MNHANYEIYIGKERAGGYATQISFEKALKNVIAQYGAEIVHTSSPHHNRKIKQLNS